jgi:transcriptional regulator with XRE-family HTH domain
MSLGKRIREFRESKGLKVAHFAAKVGVSGGTLSDIENENTSPHAETLEKLIRNTDIDPAWLFEKETWPGQTRDRVTGYKFDLAAVPYESRELVNAVVEIMASEDETTKAALKMNVAAFKEAVYNKGEVKALRRDLEAIKKVLNPSDCPTDVKEE